MSLADLRKKEISYHEKYGHLPNTQDELLEYLRNSIKLDMKAIEEEEERVRNIPWGELDILMYVVPEVTPRPRTSRNGHFYVKGASDNKILIKQYINQYNIIFTKVHFELELYLPTPVSSMTNNEIYRAELGSIEPTIQKDWDNLGKTYSDMIQDRLITNDNLITIGKVVKRYSIKPRVLMKLRYQQGFDSKFNEKRITKSTAYLNAVQMPFFEDYVIH